MGRLKSSFFSTNKNWYIGYCKRVPNTNKCTERFNGTMKIYQLFHRKEPFKQFIHTSLWVVEERSRQYIMDKNAFQTELKIPADLIEAGCYLNVNFVEDMHGDGSVKSYFGWQWRNEFYFGRRQKNSKRQIQNVRSIRRKRGQSIMEGIISTHNWWLVWGHMYLSCI